MSVTLLPESEWFDKEPEIKKNKKDAACDATPLSSAQRTSGQREVGIQSPSLRMRSVVNGVLLQNTAPYDQTSTEVIPAIGWNIGHRLSLTPSIESEHGSAVIFALNQDQCVMNSIERPECLRLTIKVSFDDDGACDSKDDGERLGWVWNEESDTDGSFKF